jgi:hypothetical protein
MPDEEPAELFSPGEEIVVAGEKGTFLFRGIGKDGSVLAYSSVRGTGARSFPADWCAPADCNGKRVRSAGAEATAARLAWMRSSSLLPDRTLPDCGDEPVLTSQEGRPAG